jgi:hypothetical protein
MVANVNELIDEALDAMEPHSGADLIKMIGRLVDALDDANSKYNTYVFEARMAARGLALRPTEDAK